MKRVGWEVGLRRIHEGRQMGGSGRHLDLPRWLKMGNCRYEPMLSHWENWLYWKSAEVGLAGIVPGAIQEAQITRLRMLVVASR
jgi:hypothetical protein